MVNNNKKDIKQIGAVKVHKELMERFKDELKLIQEERDITKLAIALAIKDKNSSPRSEVKNAENIIKFRNKYKTRQLSWGSFFLKKVNNPGNDNIAIMIGGKKWKKL